MKTYKAGDLREDMLVVPVHVLEAGEVIDRDELKRLRADSAELDRLRMVGVDYRSAFEEQRECAGFDFFDGCYWLRPIPGEPDEKALINADWDLWQAAWKQGAASSIPEGFALVPVEVKRDAERYQWLRNYAYPEMECGDICRLFSNTPSIIDGKVDDLIAAAPKGDGHE